VGQTYKAADTAFLPPDLPTDVAADWQSVFSQWLADCLESGDGSPLIQGTDIPVKTVSDFLLQEGGTFKQVRERYPVLNNQQIAVALRWGQLS
jgi:uncharacterized protein (DUF433 family)